MIHQLSGGVWGVGLRRPIGAASRILPVMTALFLPIAIGVRLLYPWTNADLVAQSEFLHHKHIYLNIPFFLIRAAVYFVVWNALAYFTELLQRQPENQNRSVTPPPVCRL